MRSRATSGFTTTWFTWWSRAPAPGVSLWTLGGDLITRWRGREGPGKGTIVGGHGLCVDLQGSIYVTEIGEGLRVTKFQKV